MSDLDRYQYGYDQNSNRLYKANVVGTPIVTGGLDEYYTYDNLNSLTVMQRGTLNSGKTGITGTPSREMDYTLDPTGNWAAYLTKTNGTTDLNQTRTANTVNEITAIGGTPAWATPPGYDAAGNMTGFPQPGSPSSNFTATYDAWNRMVSISDSGGSVATYQYDGRGRRIVKYTASISETRHFYYTDSWQDIEERVGTATTMDKQYVWGARYIDELVCRDDATPQRLYAMQDANFNLTSIASTSGSVVERYLFDPYGNRTIMNGSWGTISASAYSWVIGHQGLMHDEECELMYVRDRFLNSALGKWMQQDPELRGSTAINGTLPAIVGRGVPHLLTNDGMNPYEFERSQPTSQLDPSGRSCFLAVDCDHTIAVYYHCGILMLSYGVQSTVNGSGGGTNTIGIVPNGTPNGTTGPFTRFPDSVCSCISAHAAKWNALKVPRDHFNRNSNWTMHCMLNDCGLTVAWGAFGAPSMGWNCSDTKYLTVCNGPPPPYGPNQPTQKGVQIPCACPVGPAFPF